MSRTADGDAEADEIGEGDAVGGMVAAFVGVTLGVSLGRFVGEAVGTTCVGPAATLGTGVPSLAGAVVTSDVAVGDDPSRALHADESSAKVMAPTIQG